MSHPISHIRHQLPVIATLGKVLSNKLLNRNTTTIPELPSSSVRSSIPPRSPRLVKDFIQHTGGCAEKYAGLVPFHMFPQWSFPIGAKTNLTLPYDFTKVINLGCDIEVNGPLRLEESLELTGQIESIDDNGERAIITNKLITETSTSPKALVVYQKALIPLKRTKAKKVKEKARVPSRAELIDSIAVNKSSGLEFAFLTGDFNPLHWSQPWARKLGFSGSILHGYSSMSRTLEILMRSRLTYDGSKISPISISFTAPLPLPSKAGVFIDDNTFYLGAAKGGIAYLVGTIG